MKLELKKLKDNELWEQKRKREEEVANISHFNGGRQRELYLKLMGNIAKLDAEIMERQRSLTWGDEES